MGGCRAWSLVVAACFASGDCTQPSILTAVAAAHLTLHAKSTLNYMSQACAACQLRSKCAALCLRLAYCAQAVREGSWWTRAETDSQLCELEGVASLQQLAAMVEEGAQDPAASESLAGSPAAAAPAAAGQQHEAQVSSNMGPVFTALCFSRT